MAHTKSGGKVKNGRDSQGQRLGIKAYADQVVSAGSILVRQKGMEFYPGNNVKTGKDHTLFATLTGKVLFTRKHVTKFNNRWVSTRFIHITPLISDTA